MAVIKVLFEGYASAESGGHSSPTISLVQDNNLNIVVDPGTVPNQQIILDALKIEGLEPDDIDIIYATHCHMDHIRNIGMFPKAKVLDYYGWWVKDMCIDFVGKITEDIEVIKTPGHSYDGTTLLIKTKHGVVAICGDVFWGEYSPEIDPFAINQKELNKSRKKVLESAGFIIPGHSKMFVVE